MSVTIYSPVAGVVKPLDEVDDDVFRSRMMGDGIAIAPADVLEDSWRPLVSPVTGTVSQVKCHAVTINVGSVMILLHMGIDSYAMTDAFDMQLTSGQHVEAGQHIGAWRPDIVDVGCKSTDVVVVAMGADLQQMADAGSQVAAGEPIFVLG